MCEFPIDAFQPSSANFLPYTPSFASHNTACGRKGIRNQERASHEDHGFLRGGGSFTEYYAIDYSDNVVLMGHDGPGHLAPSEGKTKVRPLGVYHGKVGRGLSLEMSVTHGPVTLLSVVQTAAGKLTLLVAEGESVPGPILEIGNTNSRYRFSIGARNFLNEWNVHGPAHHCAVGVGHVSSKSKKLGSLLGMECVRVG